jgi:hypothetical protein
MDLTWKAVFSARLGRDQRSQVIMLQGVRNRWAHQQEFSDRDAHRAIDNMELLLASLGVPEASELEQLLAYRGSLIRENAASEVLPREGSVSKFGPSPPSLPARFVDDYSWMFWREDFHDDDGILRARGWAMALDSPDDVDIPDFLAGPDPAQSILCVVHRRSVYNRVRAYSWMFIGAFSLTTVVFLLFGAFATGSTRLVGSLIVGVMGYGYAWSALRGSLYTKDKSSHFDKAQWSSIVDQVRDLVHAAEDAERSYPPAAVEIIAQQNPAAYAARADEIERIYAHPNNPISTPERRQRLGEFICDNMSGEFDIVRERPSGQSMDERIEPLQQMLRSYWEREHVALLHVRVTLGGAQEPYGLHVASQLAEIEADYAGLPLTSERIMEYRRKLIAWRDQQFLSGAGVANHEVQARRTLIEREIDESVERMRRRAQQEQTPGS